MKIFTENKYEEIKKELFDLKSDKKWLETENEQLKIKVEGLNKDNKKKLEQDLKEQKWAILCDKKGNVVIYNDGRIEENVKSIECTAGYDSEVKLIIEK